MPATKPGEIERDDAPVAQRFGNVALDDALREAFGDRRLADAGLADERGIVLRAARENLNDPLDFVVTPDDRIELVIARQLREVAPVGIERRSLALAFWSGRLALGAEQRRRLHAHLRGIDAEIGQHASGDAFAFANQAEKQVLGPDVVVIELTGLFEGELDDALCARA